MVPIFRGVSIVGYSYLDEDAKQLHEELEQGEEVTLEPVTNNEFDPLAVEVWADMRVGYLAKEISPVIHYLKNEKIRYIAKVTDRRRKTQCVDVFIIEEGE